MHIHSSYLHRMTALYAIQVLTESLDVEMLGKVCIITSVQVAPVFLLPGALYASWTFQLITVLSPSTQNAIDPQSDELCLSWGHVFVGVFFRCFSSSAPAIGMTDDACGSAPPTRALLLQARVATFFFAALVS